MLRNDRSIDPDPHQPRRVTTTLNKHEGSPFASTKSTPHHRPVRTGVLTNTGGPSSQRGSSRPSLPDTNHASSRPLPRLWVIRCHTRAGSRVADQPRAHQFPSTGTTGQETGPQADDLFHEPEHSPENRHTRGPLPGHRSDHAHRHRDALQVIQTPLWARKPGFATLVHIILEQQVSL